MDTVKTAATRDVSVTVRARFGLLGSRFGVLLPAGRRHRRSLGLSLAEQQLIEQLLSHYDARGVWRSFSQMMLGEELGIARSTVSEQLKRLRGLGLVATRTDSRFGTRARTLFYCLEPYLAVLAMREGFDHFDEVLWAEGNDRLLRFVKDVEWGTWTWEVASLETFRGAYLVTKPPTPLAVPMTAFVAEGQSNGGTPLSVPPTQEDNHLSTSTSVQQVEGLVTRELTTHRPPRRPSVPGSGQTPLGDEQPDHSAHNPEQGTSFTEDDALDWIGNRGAVR